jgi:hypothetical protein
LATFNTHTPAWEHFLAIFPSGIGFGGTITLLLIALISAVPIKDQATATGVSYLFRSTGAVVGITTTQCVLQNLLKTWLNQRIQGPNAEYVRSPYILSNLNRLLLKFVNLQIRYIIRILFPLRSEM